MPEAISQASDPHAAPVILTEKEGYLTYLDIVRFRCIPHIVRRRLRTESDN